MNRYHVESYNLAGRQPIRTAKEVDAVSAFDALCRADIGLPLTGRIATTSQGILSTWAARTANPEMAAADNRHWQRDPATGLVGAQAYRIA